MAGKDLTITLSVPLQNLAEGRWPEPSRRRHWSPSGPRRVRSSAAANGAGTDGYSVATVGQAPPGSTFKVASSLALLRAGLTPDSRVTCPGTRVVDGKPFVNYSDYPSGSLGTITLETAVAQSCNTAFIGQRSEARTRRALLSAAGSLGVGHRLRRRLQPPTSGPCPRGNSGPARRRRPDRSGRGLGVAAGHGVGGRVGRRRQAPCCRNWSTGTRATSKAQPLTAAEARQLRTMMRAVVTEGSGPAARRPAGPAGHRQDRNRRVRQRRAACDPRLDDRCPGGPRRRGVRPGRRVRIEDGRTAAAVLPRRGPLSPP